MNPGLRNLSLNSMSIFKSFNEALLLQHLNWVDNELKTNNVDIQTKAREVILDTIGCAYASFHSQEMHQLAKNYSKLEKGSCQIHCYKSLSISNFVQLFTYGACWDEACEGNAVSHGRPGISTLASLLPFAHNLTLGELLNHFIVGYEVSCKLAEMLRIKPGMHVDGNWPAFGSAVAVAKCIGLTNPKIIDSINLAACQIPMSLYLPIKSGANARNSYLGHAANLGIQSAMDISAGIVSPPNAVTEYAKIALNNESPVWNSTQTFNLLRTYIKPFASVRHVHYAAYAAIALKNEMPLESIEKIELKIYKEAIDYCGNRSPSTPIQAQFSLSFGVACALMFQDINVSSYEESILLHPMIRQLENLVEISIDEQLTKLSRRGASLTLYSKGSCKSACVTSIEGDIDTPISQSSIIDKFIKYTSSTLNSIESSRMCDAILNANATTPWREIANHLGGIL
jgi:2-methylcitrate dehydratase PrpD